MPATTINDASGAPPRLRLDLNMATLWSLPEGSQGPRGLPVDAQLSAIRAAGYEGVQGADAGAARQAGLKPVGLTRILRPQDAAPIAEAQAGAGFEATTILLGWGLETDAEAHRLIEAVLDAAQTFNHPMFVETHRGTVTQDIRRTLGFLERFPDLHLNADLSHWYTGHELGLVDWPAKLAVLAPAFARVGFMHGRIGDTCAIQVPLTGREQEPFVQHFRQMWTGCFAAFLRRAAPGDVMVFAPELLPAETMIGEHHVTFNYARRVRQADGEWREESDRWLDALALCAIARECFDEAQAGVAAGG